MKNNCGGRAAHSFSCPAAGGSTRETYSRRFAVGTRIQIRPVTATLFVKSSAVDTDFTAKLVDVASDGLAQDLTEGILRMRYRVSPEHIALMNPGQIYEISLDLWATSNVFLRGHSLRLEISSSNFPRFDRNLNTGEEIRVAHTSVASSNTILHDAQHPSALVLPIMPSN